MKTSHITKSFLVGLSLGLLAGAMPATAPAAPAIIPEPQKMELHDGTFLFQPDRRWLGLFPREGTKIVAAPDARAAAGFLAAQIRQSTGHPISISDPAEITATGNILITSQDANEQLGDEGYELTVTPHAI